MKGNLTVMSTDITNSARSNANTKLSELEKDLDVESFPMNLEEINYAVGDAELMDPKSQSEVPVRDLTESVVDKPYVNANEVVENLRQALQKNGSVE
jgi:hypothetical protein